MLPLYPLTMDQTENQDIKIILSATIVVGGDKQIQLPSATASIPSVHDLSSSRGIQNALDSAERAIAEPSRTVNGALLQKTMDVISEASIPSQSSQTQRVHAETVVGNCCVDIPRETATAENLGKRATFRSTFFLMCILLGAISQSFRTLADSLNRCLYRKPEEFVCYRTISNICDEIGEEASSYLLAKAKDIVCASGFTIVDGLPILTDTNRDYSYTAEPLSKETIKQIYTICRNKNYWNEKRIKREIAKDFPKYPIDKDQEQEFNKRFDEEMALVFIDPKPYISTLENSKEDLVIINIDAVLSDRQKEKRGEPPEKVAKKDRNLYKSGGFISNYVGTIETSIGEKTFNGKTLNDVMLLLVACLCENNLLKGHRLLIFADGASDIRDAVEKVFSFRQYNLYLCWYHLKKKVKEYLSMALAGSKEEKAIKKGRIVSALWSGNCQLVIDYLTKMKPEEINNLKARDDLIGYLERKKPYITCYHIRKKLHLRNSSNHVEQENFIIISKRQKNDGMSWTQTGSSALATITSLARNDDLETYVKTGEISFKITKRKQTSCKQSA